MDEELENSYVTSSSLVKRDKSCSLAAMRPRPSTHVVSSSTSSYSPSSRNRRWTRSNAVNNGYTAY